MDETLEVRTRSLSTTAVMLMLGHEPLGIRADGYGAPLVRFAQSAEADLRRYHAAKRRAEQYVDAAQRK